MVNDNKKILRLKEEHNHLYDTDELLWLLKDNEHITAKEFICKQILGIRPEDMMDIFEYTE